MAWVLLFTNAPGLKYFGKNESLALADGQAAITSISGRWFPDSRHVRHFVRIEQPFRQMAEKLGEITKKCVHG
jgi:hypothetical protein